MKELIMHDIHWLMFWCFLCGFLMAISIFLFLPEKKKARSQKNKNYSITEVCPHDIAEIKVIATVGTCETTVLVCTECKEQITESKTDCR